MPLRGPGLISHGLSVWPPLPPLRVPLAELQQAGFRKSSEIVLDLQVQNEYYKRVVKTTTHTGVSSNGKISVSKTAHGGSNPSTPAKEKESDDGLVPFFVWFTRVVAAARAGEHSRDSETTDVSESSFPSGYRITSLLRSVS